jgi:hypothetical protein
VPVPTPKVCPKPNKPIIDGSKLPDGGSVNPDNARFDKNKQYNLGPGMFMVAAGGLPDLNDATDKLVIKVRAALGGGQDGSGCTQC